MDEESIATVAVEGDMEFFSHIFEGKNIGDRSRIEPNLSIVLDVGLVVGDKSATVTLDGHGIVDLMDVRNESLVAKKINRGLLGIQRIFLITRWAE